MAISKAVAGIASLVSLAMLAGPMRAGGARMAPQAQSGSTLTPAYLDKLLAPVALYPDQLLAQILLCSGNARKVGELSTWLKQMSTLKGSELQKAAGKAGFEPSFVALAPFPQVVDLMAGNLDLDFPAGRGVRGRSQRGVRQHPASAEAEPGGRQPEEHAPADRGDADHKER